MKPVLALSLAGLLVAAVLTVCWLTDGRAATVGRGENAASPDATEPGDDAPSWGAPELREARTQLDAAPDSTAETETALTKHAARLASAKPDVRRVHFFGRVEDLQSAPIAGAALLAPKDDPEAVLARTDSEGRFDVDLALAVERPPLSSSYDRGSERLNAAVWATGFAPRGIRFDVRDGARFHLGTLRLVPAVPASGLIVYHSGRPVKGAVVSWFPASELAPLRDGLKDDGDLDYMPQRTPAHSGLRLDTTSATDGSFELLGVPRQPGLLLAQVDGRAGITDLIDFTTAGQRGVRIELPDGPPEVNRPRIVGTVLRPDGNSHPTAEVEASASADWIVGYARSDEEGRFEIIVNDQKWELSGRPNLTVRASDPDQRFSPGEVVNVTTDGPALQIHLSPPKVVEVRLLDRDGMAVPWGNVRTENSGLWPLTPLGAEGRGTFLLPERTFTIEAFAPGFRPEVFGPFSGTRSGDLVDLVLTPGQAVRGIVTAKGRPVEGARVALTPTPYPAGFVARARGVAPTDIPFDIAAVVDMDEFDATTAADGRFVATIHSDDWYTIAAEADGYARRVLGPFELTCSEGAAGLVLELERPGAIEGRVLVPLGESAVGRLVAASNGLGEAWVVESDVEGHFVLEGLAPGGWQLRPGVPPLGERVRLGSGGPGRERVPRYDVEVRAGETTKADLDLASLQEYELEGRVTLDGKGVADAGVRLLPGDWTGIFGEQALVRGKSDADGNFSLRTTSGGLVTLALDFEELLVIQPLELPPGITTASVDLQAGAVLLRGNLPRSSIDEPLWITLRVHCPGGALAFRRILGNSDSGQPLRFEPVPQGDADLLYAPIGEFLARGHLDPQLWTQVASLRLKAGCENVLELP